MRHLLTAVVALALTCSAAGQDFGKIISLDDGDSGVLLVGKDSVRFRLLDIDTPEKRGGQAFWKASKKYLSNLTEGHTLRIEGGGTDRYHRRLVMLYLPDALGGHCINMEMVRTGHAWWNWPFSRDINYRWAEDSARALRRGIWKDPKAIPPWEWRRGKRNK